MRRNGLPLFNIFDFGLMIFIRDSSWHFWVYHERLYFYLIFHETSILNSFFLRKTSIKMGVLHGDIDFHIEFQFSFPRKLRFGKAFHVELRFT